MFEHFAYLDPSTGSLFIQSVIGSIAGLSFVFRRTIASVVRKVSGNRASKDTQNAEAE